ncbi:MAG: hypothetical protein Q7J65_07250 [Candidatus Marinimicrobia bacterium]|nr:hypothetical protein [Candidatus Neomarinimicrobiota bacterium]
MQRKNTQAEKTGLPAPPISWGSDAAGRQAGRLNHLISRVRDHGQKTGIIIDCFQNKRLYSLDDFTAPVAYTGAAYNPVSNYYPVCPNNPIGIQDLLSKIDGFTEQYSPDYLYLDHFQFPFNWKEEELDIQDKSPQFCYCPFCITEFSSVVGEIVNSGEQIEEMMPEWLEWRTDAVLNLIFTIKEHVANKTQLIIGLPPLAVIDLPFSTGLLPYSIVDEGLIVSPQLYHSVKQKKLIWIEDVLDQYRIDLNLRKVWPFFEVNNQHEFDFLQGFENQYGGLILSNPIFH